MADGMPNESMVAQTPAKSDKDSEKPSATPGSVLKKSSTKAIAAPKTSWKVGVVPVPEEKDKEEEA